MHVQAYVCKSLKKSKLTEEDRDGLHLSIRVLRHLAREGSAVLRLHDVFEDAKHIHLIVEACTGGDLFDRILKEKGGFNEARAAQLILSIAQFVDHCHDMSVVHRSIKPESFMFESPDSDRIVSIDFSASAFIRHAQLTDVPSSCSPQYLTPEMIQGSYGKECDVWSMGVMLYILLSGSPPFDGDDERSIYEAILHSPLDLKSEPWPKVSSSAKELLRKMLMRDPKRRFTVSQVMSHPWIKEKVGAADASSEGIPEVLTRMQNFQKFNKLKKQAFRIMASSLPEDYIEGLRSIFEGMDKDGSGLVSIEEMRKGLRTKGAVLGTQEVLSIINAMDLDTNSQIDLKEFTAATLHKVAMTLSEREKRESLTKAFEAFDIDGSGTISLSELRSVLKDRVMTEKELEECLRECDKDQDSMISFAEFTSMMFKKEEKAPVPTPAPVPAPAPAPVGATNLKAPATMEPRASGAKKLAPLPKQAFDATPSISVLGQKEDGASERGSSASSVNSSVVNSSLLSDHSIFQVV